MNAIFFVLNNADLLSSLLSELQRHDIKGGTIFDSSGMGRELAKHPEFQIVGTLRAILNPDLKPTKTLMFIMDQARIPTLVEAIENVVGSLERPNSGIMFSIPVDFVKGLKL